MKAADRCAHVSRRLDEPLDATASRVRRWLLVEQPGSWGRDALFESRLDAAVARALAARADEVHARVVLVRQGVGSSDGEPLARRWFAARTEPALGGVVSSGVVSGQVAAAEELLAVDLRATMAAAAGPGAVGHPPVFLVCTNGKHDACCAEFGRPVYRELTEACPDDAVFECSHIGGDRFAANLVCLPTGVYYGRVPPERAATLLEEHHQGRIDLACYRGRCFHTPPEQAAEIDLRRREGLVGLDDVAVIARAALDDRRRRWGVTLTARTADGQGEAIWQAEVERSDGEELRILTCAGDAQRPPVFAVRSWARSR